MKITKIILGFALIFLALVGLNNWRLSQPIVLKETIETEIPEELFSGSCLEQYKSSEERVTAILAASKVLDERFRVDIAVDTANITDEDVCGATTFLHLVAKEKGMLNFKGENTSFNISVDELSEELDERHLLVAVQSNQMEWTLILSTKKE